MTGACCGNEPILLKARSFPPPGADEGKLATTSDEEAAFQDLERDTSPGGRKLEEGETVEDTVAIEERLAFFLQNARGVREPNTEAFGAPSSVG